ncbi:MAG: ester cyclase [Nitrospirae bacterium]|nr:ester cyclase [Nitrospirota bacterium]
MSTQTHKKLMRRFWREFLKPEGDLASLVSPDASFRGTLGINVRGPHGMREYATRVNTVFNGFAVRVGDMVAERDRVVARLQFSGTHMADLFGVPPTGKLVTYPGVAIATVSGGRIVDMWVTGDAATWMAAFQRLADT